MEMVQGRQRLMFYNRINDCQVLSLSSVQAVDGAHSQGNNINSLAILSSPIMPMLVSGCKGGLLKLWNPDSCANIGEAIFIITVTCIIVLCVAIN